jgi:hypothetical protein
MTALIPMVGMALATHALSQVCDPMAWRTIDPAPLHAFGAGLVADPGRGTLLLFGGRTNADGVRSTTWEWNGRSWSQLSPPTAPPARDSQAMAYDPIRGKILLFGGAGQHSTYLNDTWAWDGQAGTWSLLSASGAPTPRRGAAMFFAPELNTMVLFGGSGFGVQNDLWTWDWDAAAWNPLTQVAPPPLRAFAPVVRDPDRGTYLFFGGTQSSGTQSDETWEGDLTSGAWTRLAPAHHPDARYRHAMLWHPGRRSIVLFGGGVTTSPCQFNDTWAWDSAAQDWTQLGLANPPSPRAGAAAAYDPVSRRVVVFGGMTNLCEPSQYLRGIVDDTWLLDLAASPAGWTQVPGVPTPGFRFESRMAYDPGRERVVMYGAPSINNRSSPYTWEWNGARWSAPGGFEPRVDYADIAFDGTRVILLAPGPSGAAATWGWDGGQWSIVSLQAPPTTGSYALAFDSDRRRVILYGGEGTAGQTWEWNGNSWLLGATAGPRATMSVALAYDPAQRRTVLYGGECGVNCFPRETWLWNGGTWTLANGSGPAPSLEAWLAYDADRGKLVLVGSDAFFPAAWEWGGASWLPASGTGLTNSALQGITYDAARRRLLLFSARTSGPISDETLARGCYCYPNCDGSTVPPILNVADFICFQQGFAAGESAANCDQSTQPPVLNMSDFLCFMQRFAAGCP